MDWQGWFSLALVAGVLGTLTLTRLKPHVVMMAALTLLVTFGVLSGAEALAGFANEGLITVAAMWRMITPVALLSGFLNNTPVVATMIPAAP